MRRLFQRLRRDARGAAALEFAIVIGPFLLLTFGVIEFGRVLWTREALQETATAGARCMGMVATSCASGGSYSSANALAYVQKVAQGWNITLTSANVALNNANASCAAVTSVGGFSTVTVTYTFQSVVPSLIAAMAGGLTLTTTACFPNN